METESIIHKEQINDSTHIPKSMRSFYDSFKDNVVLNAKHYSYYTSIISLIVLIFVLYCNYSFFSTSGFFG